MFLSLPEKDELGGSWTIDCDLHLQLWRRKPGGLIRALAEVEKTNILNWEIAKTLFGSISFGECDQYVSLRTKMFSKLLITTSTQIQGSHLKQPAII